MDHIPSHEQALDFSEFANQLLEEGSQESPSYLHGGVSGVFAAAGPLASSAGESTILNTPGRGDHTL